MFVAILLIIFLILIGLFLSKCGTIGALILGIGALIMMMTGGWIGGVIWLFFTYLAMDRGA